MTLGASTLSVNMLCTITLARILTRPLPRPRYPFPRLHLSFPLKWTPALFPTIHCPFPKIHCPRLNLPLPLKWTPALFPTIHCPFPKIHCPLLNLPLPLKWTPTPPLMSKSWTNFHRRSNQGENLSKLKNFSVHGAAGVCIIWERQ